ncbi:MAG: hypothetical protein QOJ22_127 [Thermoleophilaceae bacterium]|jgi:subtilisin family serine protease|nr:hypothetical protein [Thermoleophilaceae bacterium]
MQITKLALVAGTLAVALAGPAPASADRQFAPSDGYIVVYKQSVADPGGETSERERKRGFKSRLRYRSAVKGFAAELTSAQVDALRDDPEVAFVSADRRVHALATDPVAPGEAVPTGIRRMGAGSATAAHQPSGAGVAVIDTGVDLTHPDLNAVDGTDCVNPGTPAQDDNGHGTHVAGTIGARNTGAGVVGVAPGTPVYAVKVLSASGAGTWSQVICGIDWVTANAAAKGIKVANMSLGGGGSAVQSCATTTDALHKAICRSSEQAGVTYVVAAGNDGWDFDYASAPDVPAAYPQVLTVSAVSDSDGQAGATGGAPACRTIEADDRYASFSNYAATTGGSAHTIAGPGVCINSTWVSGGYRTISGTSMATPHIAGATALCIDEKQVAGPCAGLTPADVIQKMRADAQSYNGANTTYGFAGDPLRPVSGRYFGYLAWAGVAPAPGPPPEPTPPPLTSVTAAPGAAVVQSGRLRGGSASSLATDDNAYYQVDSTASGTRTSAWYGSFAGVASDFTALTVAYKGKNSRSCTQTVAIYDWLAAAWVQLDSRAVGTSEVGVTLTPTGSLSRFRGGASGSELRVRVRCTTSKSFTASGDLLRIDYKRP